jgi:hypothetical protein
VILCCCLPFWRLDAKGGEVLFACVPFGFEAVSSIWIWLGHKLLSCAYSLVSHGLVGFGWVTSSYCVLTRTLVGLSPTTLCWTMCYYYECSSLIDYPCCSYLLYILSYYICLLIMCYWIIIYLVHIWITL